MPLEIYQRLCKMSFNVSLVVCYSVSGKAKDSPQVIQTHQPHKIQGAPAYARRFLYGGENE